MSARPVREKLNVEGSSPLPRCTNTATTSNPLRNLASGRHGFDTVQPSSLVRKFASAIISAAANYPIIDVACGSGRNALYLASLGASVICVDRDLSRLKNRLPQAQISNHLKLREMDLLADQWPFGKR